MVPPGDMVTVIVTFEIPPDIKAADVVETFRQGTQKWRERDGLIRKPYLASPDGRRAGGVYLWRSQQHADALLGIEFAQRIEAKYGSAPSIQCFETPIVIDNQAGTIHAS